MAETETDTLEMTYPLRTAARLTGLSPELLRAWERRYGVVEPMRTPGGTRRYTAADIDHLRLVKAAVDAGHRISKVARMKPDELRRRAVVAEVEPSGRIEEIFAVLENLDAAAAQQILSRHLSTLGPASFAREIAMPLVTEVGDRWANGLTGIAQEHLVSGALRSLLGSALQPTATSRIGPRIVFATPSGERHELGLLMAALTALGAGANPIYLGCEMPVDDLLGAVDEAGASVLALSIVTVAPEKATRAIGAIRGGLARDVALWIGGSGAGELALPEGVEYIDRLEDLEQRVMLLGLGRPA